MNFEREFTKLIKKCEEMMNEVGLELPFINYKLNGRLTACLGRCKRRNNFGDVSYEIELSRKYFEAYLKDGRIIDIKDTMLHEMCHAMPDGFSHGSGWTNYTRKINERFGMDIKRLGEIDEVIMKVRLESGGFIPIICEKCGYEFAVRKNTKAGRNISGCTHTGCGGHFRIK